MTPGTPGLGTPGTPAPGIPGTERTSTIKRAIKHVVVFALLGVVLSYAVAWGLYWMDSWLWSDFDGRAGLDRSDSEKFLRIETIEFGLAKSACQVDVLISVSNPEDWTEWPNIDPPYWLDDWRWSIEPPRWEITYWEAAGFPMRACCGARAYSSELKDQGFRTRGMLYFTSNSDGPYLPWEPYWPGLLINTAFYGSILWLLWITPGMIRRGSRRRRGLCVRCGYDLRGSPSGGGSVCPECGGGSR